MKALALSITLAMLPMAAVRAADPEIVVIGNPAADPMTKDQAANFFLGKSQAMNLRADLPCDLRCDLPCDLPSRQAPTPLDCPVC